MHKPKLILNNDARHYLMYRFDPPLSRKRLQSPVDEILGTGVDTLSFGLASGATFLHDSKVADKWGDSVVDHDNGVMWWRAAKNLEAALAAGMDPLQIVIDRAHEKDIQVIASMRINDAGTANGPNRQPYMCNRLKIDHPEYMIGEEDPLRPAVKTCLNFAIDEVRQERLNVIEEVCDRYGADGIEIDEYVRVFFKPSEVERNTPLLTDFMRDVRELLDRIGQKRGERLMVAARVNPREDANLAVGMDVRSWVEEKLVDAIVINTRGLEIDPEPRFGWLTDVARKNDVWLYPNVGRYPYDDRHHEPTIEMIRAVASNQMAAGADGLYLAHLLWPHSPDEYLVMRELGDPDIYARKGKHFFPARYEPSMEPWPVERHLPQTLEEGVPAIVPMTVGDDLDAARSDDELKRVTLRVRIVQTGMDDELSFTFNDSPLAVEARNISTIYGGIVPYLTWCQGMDVRIGTHYWFEFDLPIDLVQQGVNEVAVTMESRLAERVEDRVLHQVELLIEYAEPPMRVGAQM